MGGEYIQTMLPLLVFLLGFLFFPSSVSADYTLQDSYTAGTNWQKVRDSYTRVGQRFTAGSSFDLTRVSFQLYRWGSASGKVVYAEVWSDKDGFNEPLSKLGTSATLSFDSIATSATWYDFDFSTAVSLTSGSVYYVWLTSDLDASADNYTRVYANTGSGAGHAGSLTNNITYHDTAKDADFKIYSGTVEPTPTPTPTPTSTPSPTNSPTATPSAVMLVSVSDEMAQAIQNYDNVWAVFMFTVAFSLGYLIVRGELRT